MAKPSGITPTILKGRRSSVTVRPTIRWIAAETLPPHGVREDHDRVGADRRRRVVELRPPRLVRAERPAEERRHAHQGKEVLADLRGDQHLGFGIGAERAPHRVEPGDALERGRAPAPVVDVAACRAGAVDAGLRG